MGSHPTPICFREDITDARAAGEALSSRPVKSYITWRSSDEAYCLSYNSAAFKTVQHVPIKRKSDGGFVCMEAAEHVVYPTLNDLVRTRPYIATRTATDMRDDASQQEPAVDTAISSSTLHRRGQRSVGRAELPASIPLPKAREAAGPAGSQYRIDPVLPPRGLNLVFLAVVAISAAIAGTTYFTHARYSDDLLAHSAAIEAEISTAATKASKTVGQIFVRAAQGGAQVDASTCTSALTDWRAELSQAQMAAQRTFDEHVDSLTAPYLRIQLGCAVAGVCVGLLFLWVNTGARNLDFKLGDYETEEEALAALGGKREPPCTNMQFKWTLTFLALLGASCFAAWHAGSVFWDYGMAGHRIEYAARPFSMLFSKSNGTRNASEIPTSVQWMGDVTPWQMGMYGGAWLTVPATTACVDAAQPFVRDLVEHPAVLRMPAHKILPSILLPTAAAAVRSTSDDAWSIQDPLAHAWVGSGWFDGSMLVLPSTTAVAQATVAFTAVVLVAFILTMIVSDLVLDALQPCRARKGAAAAPASKAGKRRPKTD